MPARISARGGASKRSASAKRPCAEASEAVRPRSEHRFDLQRERREASNPTGSRALRFAFDTSLRSARWKGVSARRRSKRRFDRKPRRASDPPCAALPRSSPPCGNGCASVRTGPGGRKRIEAIFSSLFTISAAPATASLGHTPFVVEAQRGHRCGSRLAAVWWMRVLASVAHRQVRRPWSCSRTAFDGETGSGDGASGQSKVNYTAFAQ